MDLLNKRIVEQIREKAQARSAEQIAKGVMSKDTKQAISESTATMNRMREAMQDVVAKTISERTPDNIPSRISEPVLEGAPEKPEMGSREPYELEVDTIGNEALDSSGKTEMSKEEADYETGKKLREEALKNQSIMSKPSDDSADGVQPTDGKDFDQTVMSFVEENEGRKNIPYKDTKGLWTVGVGHFIGKELPAKYKNADGTPRTLSDEEVQTLFDEDYAKHKKEASSLPMYDQLDSKGKQALIDLTFNMGLSKFNEDKWPKFFKALKNKDLKTAAEELKDSEWFKEVKTRAPKVISLIKEASFT
jgi:GH24 family phage-related lysozyme (muramidase)